MYTNHKLANAAVNNEFYFLHLRKKTKTKTVIVLIIMNILRPQLVSDWPRNQMNIVTIIATQAENRRIVYTSKTPVFQSSSFVL